MDRPPAPTTTKHAEIGLGASHAISGACSGVRSAEPECPIGQHPQASVDGRSTWMSAAFYPGWKLLNSADTGARVVRWLRCRWSGGKRVE